MGNAIRFVAVLVLLILLAFAGLAAFHAGGPPQLKVDAGLPAIGKRTPFTIRAAEPDRGLARLRVELVQGDRTLLLAEKNYAPRPAWKLWGPLTAREEIRVEVGRDTVPGLKAGPATVRATAEGAGALLRSARTASQEVTLPVRLVPPLLQVTSIQTYVAQGGSEAVVYKVGETSVRDGVRAGSWWFPGFPLPGGGPQDRFALFAIPYDLAETAGVKLVATDDVGNESAVAFIDKFFPQPYKSDTIQLTDAFLEKVVPSIRSQTPELADRGSPLANYLAINGELRRANAQAIVELAAKSPPTFLWKKPFAPLPNAKVMSSFADRRTYVYQGRPVDHQDHLGFDLAATKATPIPAANDGIVVRARFFGIYGNAVILDHGYGLMSLYGHLSTIDVKEGQAVQQGETIGKSGDTGLAGGDHLHFTMLLGGLPVNSKEWWDGHWIQDRLARKLGAGLPLER